MKQLHEKLRQIVVFPLDGKDKLSGDRRDRPDLSARPVLIFNSGDVAVHTKPLPVPLSTRC